MKPSTVRFSAFGAKKRTISAREPEVRNVLLSSGVWYSMCYNVPDAGGFEAAQFDALVTA